VLVVYFSNVSENTHRFVEKLDRPSQRIPLRAGDLHLRVDEPFVLVTPTYGGGKGEAAVPKQVVKFLNDADNRKNLRGVVGSGNQNFGAAYSRAASIISDKCQVPVLHRFELLGTSDDVSHVETVLDEMEDNDTRR
jgi:protein involved in ribonucleotide reduction